MIYFDNNATTCLSEKVKECIRDNFDYYFNPSSTYQAGQAVKKKIEKAREQVGRLINAPSKNILFTSCATESNNAVLRDIVYKQKGKHIIVSSVEHSAILETVNYYADKECCKVTILPVDSRGRISEEDLKCAITKDTSLISIMLVNNETGNVYPIKRFVEIAKSINPNILFHTDATQAIGKLPVDVNSLGVDFLTLSGHKFHAPKGIGALYVKELQGFSPVLFGGHQESGYRAGTENLLGILAMGVAAEETLETLNDVIPKIRLLRDQFESALLSYKGFNFSIVGDRENRVCNTSCLIIEGFSGKDICFSVEQNLYNEPVCIGSGSACNSIDFSLSHVMKAMHVNQIPIRISFSRYNTQEDVKLFIKILIQTLMKIKKENK